MDLSRRKLIYWKIKSVGKKRFSIGNLVSNVECRTDVHQQTSDLSMLGGVKENPKLFHFSASSHRGCLGGEDATTLRHSTMKSSPRAFTFANFLYYRFSVTVALSLFHYPGPAYSIPYHNSNPSNGF